MNSLLERFLRYVRVGTTANEKAATYPSSPGQLVLGKMLREELLALGISDAEQDRHGLVMGTVPGGRSAPAIALVAHVDTSPETTGENVRPLVHANYDGGDLVLPGDPTKVLRALDNPELAK